MRAAQIIADPAHCRGCRRFWAGVCNPYLGITSGLPVIRPRSMRSAEITPYKADLPVLNAPGVRFVIGSLPLTDGVRPSRDVKTIVAKSADGRIQNYSRGGHHDSNQCYTTRQRARRCNS